MRIPEGLFAISQCEQAHEQAHDRPPTGREIRKQVFPGFQPFFGSGLHFRHRKSDTEQRGHEPTEGNLMTTATRLGTWRVDGLPSFGERLRGRLAPGQGERPGRPSDPSWTVQRKLSMNPETLDALERLAEVLSTEERSVSPMQVAALLVEDATVRLLAELVEQ